MIRLRTYIGTGVLLTAALLSSCSLDKEALKTDEAQPQPKTWKICIQANKEEGNLTRGVHFVDDALKSMWGNPSTGTGQPVEVWRGSTKLGTLTATASSTGSTTITGEISNTTFTKGETLTLYSPSKARDYSGQTGSLESMSSKDYVKGTVEVTAVDATDGAGGILGTSEATFSHLQSFNKITFSESVSSVTISATGLIASSNANDEITTGTLTVDAIPATNTFYVAMANSVSGPQSYTFTSGGKISTVSATVANGFYYTPSSITLTLQYRNISEAAATDAGKLICSNNHIHTTASDVEDGASPVAMICYVGNPGSVDASSSSYRGLAISLTNANNNEQVYWGENGEDTSLPDYNVSGWGTGTNDPKMDLAGISNTEFLKNKYSGYAAAKAVAYESTIAHPSSTSSWFLPTLGQWNLIVYGLFGSELSYSADNNEVNYIAFNLKLDNAGLAGSGSGEEDAGANGFHSNPCWSSNEAGSGSACIYRAGNGRASTHVKYYTAWVRPVVAF